MKRHKFSLSHSKLLSCIGGTLVPIGCLEVLPGDSFQHSTSLLLRCSPLLTPVMHPVEVRIHHWYVPLRIMWDNFEKFITGGPDGMDAHTMPMFGAGGNFATGTLPDYLGLPTGVNLPAISAFPFRAYARIWNEFYRDQDLQAELVSSTADGNDTTTNLLLQNCDWEKDFFTSARPWTQKGPEVSIPLGTTADVAITLDPASVGTQQNVLKASDHMGVGGNTPFTDRLSFNGSDLTIVDDSAGPTGYEGVIDPNGTLKGVADLSTASAATINALRTAFALQSYEEARARYGSRYTEYLRYLGIKSSDARLQRPEYLGGGKQTIQFSEVLQTAEGTAAVGTMRGHGIAAMRSNRYRRFFEEHGLVISLLSVRPKTIYAQGVSKMWSRSTKEDLFQKELQFIGQEEILNKELYAAHASPEAVFGYQDRYDTYRRHESSIAGEFRTTLNTWHLARIFGSDPTLNASFVSCVPTTRVFASVATDQFYIMAKHSLQARRIVSGSARPSIL